MSIPDLPTIQETSGQTKSGIKYHILGTVQQTLVVELQPNQVVYSDAGAMSWMTTSVNMNTTSGGGLGGMLKRAVSGATVFINNYLTKQSPDISQGVDDHLPCFGLQKFAGTAPNPWVACRRSRSATRRSHDGCLGFEPQRRE